MFLTRSRAEILAQSGREISYSTHLLYSVTKWYDRSSGALRRVVTFTACSLIAPISLIESVARTQLTFIATLFSAKQGTWLDRIGVDITTAALSIYGAFLAIFTQTLCPHLTDLDLKLRLWQKDLLLFRACEAGREDLVKKLLKRGANPHKIIQANATSALVPRMMGHLPLVPIFELNTYEKTLVTLRILSQWLNLSSSINLMGESVRLDTSPSVWMFGELARSTQRFSHSADFNSVALDKNGAQRICSALLDAYKEKSSAAIAKRISSEELTFIASGWRGHAICLTFYKGYLAISNRGRGSEKTGTLNVFKVDLYLISPPLIDQIFMQQMLDYKSAQTFFYTHLPQLLSSSR